MEIGVKGSLPEQVGPGSTSWLERGFLVAVLLGCAAAMSPNQADPDLWGHVQYGRDAMATGWPEATTTYSFTAEGYRWINHENLSEVILAITAGAVGGPGLLVLKCFISLVIIGLMIVWARRGRIGIAPLCVGLLLVALNLAYRWAVRPQIFTYLLFALMIFLVNWCFEGWGGRWNLPWLKKLGRAAEQPAAEYSSWRLRWLWLAPVIFFVWANTHGGFIASYCIFSAILALRAFEMILVCGRAGWGSARRLTMMIVASGLVTLLNPYGPNLHGWLIQSLVEPRPEISEWAPLRLSSYPIIPFALLASVGLAALYFSRRSLDFTHMVLLALTTWQGVAHERHIAFLAILFGFWMPRHIESLLARGQLGRDDGNMASEASPKARRAFAVGLCLVYLVLGARLYLRLSDMPVNRDRFPVAAIQYMAERNLTGKLVVTYNWAQYAIAALGPSHAGREGTLVAFDGRFRTCYPQEIVDMHFDFVLGEGPPGTRHRSPNSPPPRGGRALQYGQPDFVLVNRNQDHSIKVMNQHRQDWVLLYQDELAQVWGRASKYNDPASRHYIQLAERKITDLPQEGSVSWPALPVRNRKADDLAAVDGRVGVSQWP